MSYHIIYLQKKYTRVERDIDMIPYRQLAKERRWLDVSNSLRTSPALKVIFRILDWKIIHFTPSMLNLIVAN